MKDTTKSSIFESFKDKKKKKDKKEKKDKDKDGKDKTEKKSSTLLSFEDDEETTEQFKVSFHFFSGNNLI